MFQTPISAISTGMFFSSGASAKCSSISLSAREELARTRRARSRTSRRSRPPTRPRSGRRPSPTSAGSRWRRSCLRRLDVRASPHRNACRPSAWRASAFAMVSCVVKVFETTTNSVLAGVGALERALEVVRIDVGREAHVERAVAQRIGEQARAEVRAAGAEVDDAPDSVSSLRTRTASCLHALQRRAAPRRERLAGAQRGVPRGAVLGRC